MNTFNDTARETWITIERPAEQHDVICSVVKDIPFRPEPYFSLSVYCHDASSFFCDEVLESVELSIAEVRLMRDFLNRPEVMALLDV